MSDAIEIEVDVNADGKVQPPAAVYDDGEVEVFVETPEDGEESGASSKVIADLKAKQAELIAQVDPVKAMKEAVSALGGQLRPPEAPVDVTVRPNTGVQDWTKYKEEFNQQIFEDPFTKITEIVSKATEMQAANAGNQNMAYSKRIVQIDPKTKDDYARWANEVEKEVSKMTPMQRVSNPNVYEDALQTVRSRHLDEIVEERIKAEREKGGQGNAGKGSISYSEGNRATPAANKVDGVPKEKVTVSKAKMNEINAYADSWGIPVEAAVRLYRQRGQI